MYNVNPMTAWERNCEHAGYLYICITALLLRIYIIDSICLRAVENTGFYTYNNSSAHQNDLQSIGLLINFDFIETDRLWHIHCNHVETNRNPAAKDFLNTIIYHKDHYGENSNI